MDIDPQVVDAMQACVAALREVKDELRSVRSASTIQRIVVTNESKSDASRMMHTAVTSAILCAVLSIIMMVLGGMLYLNMKDHLDAIYMMAPSLQQQLTAKETTHGSQSHQP